jgi:excisionase family DNA binding protein
MEKKLLSVKELAEQYGFGIDTIYKWVCQRKIPFVKCGRLTKFDPVDILAWIKSNKVEVKNF